MPGSLTDQAYLEDVCNQIEERIADKLQLNPDHVYQTMDPDEKPEIDRGQFICTICPEDFTVDAGQFAGGGRNCFVVEGVLTITLWTRMHLDRPKDATKYIKDQQRGIFVKLRALINALTWNPDPTDDGGWQVKDQETGVALWEEPMRLVRVKLIRGQKETGLRRAETYWELRAKLQLP